MNIKGVIQPLQTIGDRLKYLRLSNDMLQKDIEAEIYIPVYRVTRLEKNTYELYNDELLSYARYFKVSPTWILTGSDTLE